MPDYRQSPRDLVRHLEEQMRFLQSSAAAYDAGDQSEAKRLALHVRVLVHDTPRWQSLLGFLQVKQRLHFIDTAGELPVLPPDRIVGNQVTTTQSLNCPLAPLRTRVDGEQRTAAFTPGLERSAKHPPKLFDEWWTAPVARLFGLGVLTRQSVVLALANKDGGAHVDPVLPEVWAQMTRGEPFITVVIEDERMPPLNPVPGIMRQIAFEIEQTVFGQLTRPAPQT